MAHTRDSSPENLARGKQLRIALLAALEASPKHCLQFYSNPEIRKLSKSKEQVSNVLSYLAKNKLATAIPVRVTGTGIRFAYSKKGVPINGASQSNSDYKVVERAPAPRQRRSGISISIPVGNREVKLHMKEARQLYEELQSFFGEH